MFPSKAVERQSQSLNIEPGCIKVVDTFRFVEWLAVTESIYYGRGALLVMLVRELVRPHRGWDEAVAALHAIRAQGTEPPHP